MAWLEPCQHIWTLRNYYEIDATDINFSDRVTMMAELLDGSLSHQLLLVKVQNTDR